MKSELNQTLVAAAQNEDMMSSSANKPFPCVCVLCHWMGFCFILLDSRTESVLQVEHTKRKAESRHTEDITYGRMGRTEVSSLVSSASPQQHCWDTRRPS